MNTTQSLAQQFAAEYAKGVVPAILKALDSGKKRTKALLYLVMAVTYWHVASYLIWHTAFGWFGLAVPAIIDLGMIQMLDILQTKGMHRQAKRFATGAAGALGLISGTFNVIAADDAFTAFGFASLVLVAIGTKVAVSLMRPDFAAIEQVEQDATTDGAAEAAIQARIDDAVKKAEARIRRQQRAELKRLAEATPVSPAPAGPVASDLIIPTAADLAAIYAR